MTVTAVIVGLILGAIGVLVSLGPIFQERAKGADRQSNRDIQIEVHDLRTRLNRLLESIRDLDFDFDTGKISFDVYAEQRKLLIGRGVSLLIRLDKAEAQLDVIDTEIEEAIAQRRSKPTRKGEPQSAKKNQSTDNNVDAAIEAAIAARREVSS